MQVTMSWMPEKKPGHCLICKRSGLLFGHLSNLNQLGILTKKAEEQQTVVWAKSEAKYLDQLTTAGVMEEFPRLRKTSFRRNWRLLFQ